MASERVVPAQAPSPGNSSDLLQAGALGQRPVENDPLETLLRKDKGMFGELAARVRLHFPSWLEDGARFIVRSRGMQFVAVNARVVGLASRIDPIPSAEFPYDDADGDGIPSQLDILVGAKKAVLNGAVYRQAYHELEFPGGDVPRGEGACTDVVVRSLRNAGIDLQAEINEDIAKAPERYPMVGKADSNIDHRRVRTLVPYFERHWQSLSTRFRDSSEPWLPGDVLVMDTVGGPEPEHIGIVSDRLGPSGMPLVINNWTDGFRTSEMDIVPLVTITHRFRVAVTQAVVARERGVEGFLRRQEIRLSAANRQLVVVTTALWSNTGGVLRRFERGVVEGAPWRSVGSAVPVRLGRRGLGRGLGLGNVASAAAPLSAMPAKREGDQRAPAGAFGLGTAFGPPSAKPAGIVWPWRSTDGRDRFVDDPVSRFYNTWQRDDGTLLPDWASAERLDRYSLGLVVRHNATEPVSGAGSAIFLHEWRSPDTPTAGCTAMAKPHLRALLKWLDPSKNPVFVQVSGVILDG